MPIYRFKCKKCEKEFEDLVAHRGDTAPCPECGCEKVEKLISTPARHITKGANGDLPCADDSCELADRCCTDGTCGRH